MEDCDDTTETARSIISIEELTDEIYKMRVESDKSLENAVAGQFVNINYAHKPF